MGYYVVGEAIALPLQENPDYLNCFPKTEKCFVFESKESAIRYANFKNKDQVNAACPLFKVKAIEDETKVLLDVKEGEPIKAKEAKVKKKKNIASASLKYLGGDSKFIKRKFSRDVLTKSFDELAVRQPSPVKNDIANSPNPSNSSNSVGITFAAIMLAAISSILLFSTLFGFTSLPALFIHMLAKWGIIFVLPSSVLTAKIWFAVSLGTLATAALMGLYYGVRFSLGLLDSLVVFLKEKVEQHQQNRALIRNEPQPDLSYLQRLSQFLGAAPATVYQQIWYLPERLPATWSWNNIKHQLGGLFVGKNNMEGVVPTPTPTPKP